MSAWNDFFDASSTTGASGSADKPGLVMINFVNRYLEPLDSIRYRVQYDGIVLKGRTTKACHTVEIQPLSMRAIRVFVWSRMSGKFKLIDQFTALPGRRLLVNERMKTFAHHSRTELHPAKQPSSASKPAAAFAPSVQPRLGPRTEDEQGVEPVKTRNAKDEPEHKTKRSPSDEILVEQLKKIFPAAADSYLKSVADELNSDLTKYKLDTPLRRAHFFAQVRQEAGATLSPRQENLNYRPSVLISKFSYYANHPDEAEADGRVEEIKFVEKIIKKSKRKVKVKTIVHAANQPKIANKAYGGRGGNGDAQSEDGWRFRGRGIFQLTLRDNYEDFNVGYSDYWAKSAVDFLSDPDKVCAFPYFIRSAVWYWIRQSVYEKADGGPTGSDVDAVTRRINGPAMDAAAARRYNFHELCYPAFL